MLLLSNYQDPVFCEILHFKVSEVYNRHFVHVTLNWLLYLEFREVLPTVLEQHSVPSTVHNLFQPSSEVLYIA